ncbi:MAG: T9SS type A sorting domain-containing protein, partial [Flavobacteriales bacterium]|nr:T9SS type A sorting domain-containing protein [Flavobacteriales bacterium]
YDITATIDDGSCEYLTCAGCTDITACNYDITATIDDGSCEYLTCAGCTDIDACNYDQSATIDDGSCEFDSCAGCTDPTALNYDPDATIDDGSCLYDCEYPTLEWEATNCDDQAGTFTVSLSVTDLGNGAPYSVTNNVNDDEVTLNFNGTIELGPFDINDAVVVTVTSTVIPNCFLTSPVLSCPNNINELEAIEWNAFPNPADQFVQLTWEGTSVESLRVLDVTGRTVLTQDLRSEANGTRVPMNQLAEGVYTIELFNGVTRSTKRLVVHH